MSVLSNRMLPEELDDRRMTVLMLTEGFTVSICSKSSMNCLRTVKVKC